MDHEQQDFAHPAETREFPNGRLDLLHIGGADIGRLTLQPGWRWSTDVKPAAGTDLCEAPHFQYHVSGTLRVRTAEGAEFDAVPGQVTALPSGHDAWVVGDDPVVVVDWWGASEYAKGAAVDATDAVARFGAAFDARDVDAVMAAMTPDCVFEDTSPPDGTRHEGPDAVRAAWEKLFTASPDGVFATEEIIPAGDRVVVRWRYSWDGGHVRGVDVFTVRDGLVAEKLSYVKG